MACCILAAFLVAQFMAMLKRWGMFWGLVPIPEDEIVDTAYSRALSFVSRPKVRMVLASVLAFELAGASTWVYLNHGEHIAETADIAWSGLQGKTVVYAGVCTSSDQDHRVRMVLAARHDASIAYN